MLTFKRKLATSLLAVSIISFGLVGCSNKPSEEQMKQLNDMKAEVESLKKDLNQSKSDKAKLEKQIGERNAKLQQVEKMKEETKKNLETLGK